MGLNASKIKGPKSSGPKGEVLAAGMYPARIAQLVDLGVQERKAWKGTKKAPCDQLWVTYELGTEFLPDEDGNPDLKKPRWVSEKLNMFPFDQDMALSTKRMVAIDPAGALGGDWARALNLPVLVQVVNRESKGKIYNNIGGVTPPMAGLDVAPLVNPPVSFDFDNPDKEVYDDLPNFLQEMIQGAFNFPMGGLNDFFSGNEDEVEAVSLEEAVLYDDDVPF